MAPAAAGTRQRRSAAPGAVTLPLVVGPEGDADPRPITRSQTTAARAASEASDGLAFLSAASFEAEAHVPAMYRLVAGGSGPTVRDKGVPSVADPDVAGFSSAFSVVDLNDRRGVWQSEPPLLKALGEDPHKQFRGCGGKDRDSARTPAGLKNLGATCYLNSLLQYLFFNVDFRQSLLHMECDSVVVRALQRVFALLAGGDRCTVDPSEFITAASIDALEQADATEFSALLLDWLQREMGQGQAPTCGNFVSSLFEGEVSQVLACMQDSAHTFERRENFYELRARLTPAVASSRAGSAEPAEGKEPGPAAGKAAKGRKPATGKAKAAPLPPVRLEHLLQETAFPDEVLDGSNQYHCPRCDRKVDARKSTRLAKLPPYLHVTVERYHYDLSKGERRKLNRSVSFPRRLELRLRAPPLPPGTESVAQVETAVPVVYECIGYLEHVSDSAHSGHYTASLLQEEEAAFEDDPRCSVEGGAEAPSDAASTRPGAPSPDDPPVKRRRCDNADVAAGLPQRGTWWTLDDATVTAVNWAGDTRDSSGGGGAAGASASQGSGCAPDRFESATAYLVLYRRSDHRPGQVTPGRASSLPAPLAAYVAEANSSFALERDKFASNSKLIEAFLAERRQAVNSLVQALQQEASSRSKAPCKQSGAAGAFSFVPTRWLHDFIHGEDWRLEELASRDASLAPVMYGQSILRSRACSERQVVDPLAVWCGEVKLVPNAVLDVLAGTGGLDGSMFLRAEEALGTEACKVVWELFQLWCQEQQHIAQILKDGKLTTTEARQLEVQGRGEEAVWVATRVHNAWRKVTRVAGCRSAAQLRADWRAFVAEAHKARWGGSSSSTASGPAAEDPDASMAGAEGGETEGSPSKKLPVASAEPGEGSAAAGPEVSLLTGLTCMHGLCSRPRAAFLVRRADVVRLLGTSSAKERLYMELWPGARSVPRYCSGLPGGQLLGFSDVCTECRGDVGAIRTVEDAAGLQLRTFAVRRRFSSGCHRKQGTVTVPLTSEAPVVTCRQLRAACREKLGWPVARLLVLGQDGEDVEPANDDVISESVSLVTIEKDESATPAEREGAAFEGSVFLNRMAPAQA